MYGWTMELWEVRNDGSNESVPVDSYPRVQKLKMVVRNERGQFHGATNFKERIPKAEKQKHNEIKKSSSGSRVSRRATGLRLVK